MTKYCIVCKKRYVPSDSSFSFHCFPKNGEQKAIWMEKIGISSVPQNARVCQDHFEHKQYRPHENYRSKLKRLRSDAVPNVERKVVGDITNTQNSTNQNLCSGDINKTAKICQVIFKPNILIGFSNTSPLQRESIDTHTHLQPTKQICILINQNCESTINENNTTEISKSSNFNTIDENKSLKSESPDGHAHVQLTEKVFHPSINSESVVKENDIVESNKESSSNTVEKNGNLKRKRSSQTDYEAFLRTTKRYKWKHGTVNKVITSEDFKSDEAWNDFVILTVQNRNKNEALRKKCERRDKIIYGFQDKYGQRIRKKRRAGRS